MPLAALTAVGMLATDLYLPAIPRLAANLGGTLAQSQWTLSSFLAALAFSQIFWGWASDRFGESTVLLWGVLLLLIGSIMGALASQMESLIVARAIQGLGAGASTAAVPSLLRRRFDDVSAVRAIAAVGAAESIVPAVGPVIGAWIISYFEWRATFWIIAALALLLTPITAQILRSLPTSRMDASPSRSLLQGVRELLRNRNYLHLSIAYSLMFGALLMFVGSAPQLVVTTLHQPVQAFSTLQVLGVIAFAIAASISGKWLQKRGTTFLMRIGALIQIFACLILGVSGFLEPESFPIVVIAWCLFGFGLGIRGPLLMANSLKSAGPLAGQAAGLLMFTAFGCSAAATAAIGPFLYLGLKPIAFAMLGMILMSTILTQKHSSS